MTDATGSAPRTGGPTALPVYLTAAALARTADEGARVALVMLAAQRAHSPALGGALVAALMVPHVVAAPVAGALADSVRRRRLFHGGGVALYGSALAALAALVGRTGDLVVLALAAAAGCVASLLTGGLTSLLGELLPKDRLTGRSAPMPFPTTWPASAGPLLPPPWVRRRAPASPWPPWEPERRPAACGCARCGCVPGPRSGGVGPGSGPPTC
ncbi:hypothetical protein [Streptomyces sp. NPDC048192]|uniref:hypothetical protein n=1 Tax=Streptomyces sp. NPDC048192 TaxID=3365510 RepID=UPI003721D0E7